MDVCIYFMPLCLFYCNIHFLNFSKVLLYVKHKPTKMYSNCGLWFYNNDSFIDLGTQTKKTFPKHLGTIEQYMQLNNICNPKCASNKKLSDNFYLGLWYLTSIMP